MDVSPGNSKQQLQVIYKSLPWFEKVFQYFDLTLKTGHERAE